MKKVLLVFSMAFAIIGCREETAHETSTSSSSTSSTITTTTSAKITVLKSSNSTPQKNISVLMFKSKPSITGNQALPTILKEVVTNDKGEAIFDLSSMVTSSTGEKFYFGAFRKSGDSYVLLSTYFPERVIKKNSVISTVIPIN
ncbi:hypothetical protein [Bergeyella zoohelcum]|uniref:Lipoprotein n=1 Tax=Bergeyella zoohelcum TaxID=1015 RepID=A0A7Z8YMX1_9FLAO|nr:hypothetical protein [Bergeyella zoohelcum]VDH03656.1 Uncharacterised protein [Bergeyella zoohelcum]